MGDLRLAKYESDFLDRMSSERVVVEALDSEGATTAIHQPGKEVNVSWSSRGTVKLLARQDGRFKWVEMGEWEAGTYALRCPAGDFRDWAIQSEGAVLVRWHGEVTRG